LLLIINKYRFFFFFFLQILKILNILLYIIKSKKIIRMRNIIFLIFFFAKVLSVYGLVEPKTDFEKLNNFFNKYIFDDYLNTTNKNLVNITIANDGKSITSMYVIN